MTKQAIIEICRPSMFPARAGDNLGSAFYVKDFGLLVTTADLVQKAAMVMLTSEYHGRVSAPVVYRDRVANIAFLELPEDLPAPGLPMAEDGALRPGETVYAVNCMLSGWPAAQAGTMESNQVLKNGTSIIRTKGIHYSEAADGTLLNNNGQVTGLTVYEVQQGKPVGYAIAAGVLREAFRSYAPHARAITVRCASCRTVVVTTPQQRLATCTVCGTEAKLPIPVTLTPPTGMPGVIENALIKLGKDMSVCRNGVDAWNITEAGACILLYWSPYKSNTYAFAHLCNLPEDPDANSAVYRFLLRENRRMGEFAFSIIQAKVQLRYRFNRPEMDENLWFEVLQRLLAAVRHYAPLLKKDFGCKQIRFQ